MDSVTEIFKDTIKLLIANSQKQSTVTHENVLQLGNKVNQEIVLKLVETFLLPGSGVRGMENLKELVALSKQGKACLLLVEHYSNFDLPGLIALLRKEGAPEIADDIIAIAGFKLNEEHPLVLAFTEAFTRIVIYPSRSLAAIKDPELLAEETQKSNRLNMAAMKELTRAKYHGNLILVFPAGTRFRPSKPETKIGLKEIDTYLKSFEYFVPIAINGNVLRIDESSSNMQMDKPTKDVLIFTAGKVQSTSEFRKAAQADCPEGEDVKQFTVNRVMSTLDLLHEETEVIRQKLL